MDIKEHMQPEKLQRYAFYWSVARMLIAALSLFFGAMPIVYKLGVGSLASLLPLFWLVSGVASVYLIYMWYKSGQKVFGGTEKKDMIAFFVMVVTGLNLGYTGLSNLNIGMNMVWDMPIADLIFKATAVVYVVVAVYMYKRWKASGETLFGQEPVTVEPIEQPPQQTL